MKINTTEMAQYIKPGKQSWPELIELVSAAYPQAMQLSANDVIGILAQAVYAKAEKWAAKQAKKLKLQDKMIKTLIPAYSDAAEECIVGRLDDIKTGVTEITVCDVTGSTDNVRTVSVEIDGEKHTMQLANSEIDKLPIGFVVVHGRASRNSLGVSSNTKAIREWAIANGLLEPGSRGRIGADILAAYDSRGQDGNTSG